MKELAFLAGLWSKKFRRWYYQKYNHYLWGINYWVNDTYNDLYD